MVWNLVEEMAECAGGQAGRGREGRHQNGLFCADNGMIASSDPRYMLGIFITLVGMFNQVGIKTNVGKKSGIFCHTCQSADTQSEAAYEWWMTGAGLSYQERKRVQV